MSNIDKRALREAAERAESDSWGYDRDEFNEALTPAAVMALLDELEAAEKRIAELEAREVKLPNPHAHLIWIQAGHAPDDYWDDVAVSHSEKDKCCDGSDRYPVYTLWEIKEALSAIGINIAAAGKGE
ncbi:ead/Ea22-like family protein [Enterobacter hormaechei]|uniref:ead/Ea22-like family protein n=1 Tax=Enterobacter hormaechei TaxID=158836 RepID=UPI002FF93739